MLEPVPLVSLPRPNFANTRAATRSAVNGATAERSASTPRVSCSTNAASCSLSARITCSIAASSSTSWPGRHCKCRSAMRAVSVTRGSMTMSFSPRARASCSRFAGLKDGMPPHIDTGGLAPTSGHTSASAKACGPAPQRPCRAIEIGLPGWSIVALVKRIGEPSASMNASRNITPAGDVDHRLASRHRPQFARRVASQRMKHAHGIAVESVVVAALDATVAVVYRALEVADDTEHAAVRSRDRQATGRVAEPADRGRPDHGGFSYLQEAGAVRKARTPPRDQKFQVKSMP
jgi:hypothetical protein